HRPGGRQGRSSGGEFNFDSIARMESESIPIDGQRESAVDDLLRDTAGIHAGHRTHRIELVTGKHGKYRPIKRAWGPPSSSREVYDKAGIRKIETRHSGKCSVRASSH